MSTYDPEEYQRNKESHKVRNKRYLLTNEAKQKRAETQRKYRKCNPRPQDKVINKIRLENHKQKYREYMSDKICSGIDCGYSDWRSLVWHHTNPYNKKNGVIQLLNKNYAWDFILKEISKCICLCHNCHNILHNHQSSPQPPSGS